MDSTLEIAEDMLNYAFSHGDKNVKKTKKKQIVCFIVNDVQFEHVDCCFSDSLFQTTNLVTKLTEMHASDTPMKHGSLAEM